jgi:metallophosphoesterase superfamily enzyme
MTNCVLVHSDWLLTPQCAAIHLPTATAVVADPHLGYDLARLRGGDAMPAVSIEEQLDPLRQTLSQHAVRRLLVAGDLVEGACCQSLIPVLQTWLRKNGVEWFGLVPGNHDQGLTICDFPIYHRGMELGGWTVVHGDVALPRGRVVHGHSHPYFRWTDHVGGPCFLVSSTRIILPALSADSAGLNVRGSSRWNNYRCCVIAGDRVLDMGLIRDIAIRKKVRPGKGRRKRYSPGRR